MCTVSFLPLKNGGFSFISNRDEAPNRPTLPPKNLKGIIAPKDELKGGTWIALSQRKRLVCVLNGARQKHQRKQAYRKSRGLVLMDVLNAKDNLESFISSYDFSNIEPFTMIIVDWDKDLSLYELIWDEKEFEFSVKSTEELYVWSSSTLYDFNMKAERKEWFDNQVDSVSTQLEFHHYSPQKEYGIIMKRPQVATQSISHVLYSNGLIRLDYTDLIKGNNHLIEPKW